MSSLPPPLHTGPQLSAAPSLCPLPPSHKPAHETLLPGKAADRRRPRPVPNWAGAPHAARRPLPAQQVGRRASPVLQSWTLWHKEATW